MLINRKELYEKASESAEDLLEIVLSNLDDKIEKRLPQNKIQHIKKYYFNILKYEYKKSIFVISFFISIVLISIVFKTNFIEIKTNPFLLFSMLSIFLIFGRFIFDEFLSTYRYINRLIGDFNSKQHTPKEVIKYLEFYTFFYNYEIKVKNYFILLLISNLIIFVGFLLENYYFLLVFSVLAFITIFDFPFIIKNKERLEK